MTGVAMPWGEQARSFPERFARGSLRPTPNAFIETEHRSGRYLAWAGGGGLELRDEPDGLTFEAKLPRTPGADRALAEIRAGIRRGVSVEFVPISETRVGGGA